MRAIDRSMDECRGWRWRMFRRSVERGGGGTDLVFVVVVVDKRRFDGNEGGNRFVSKIRIITKTQDDQQPKVKKGL